MAAAAVLALAPAGPAAAARFASEVVSYTRAVGLPDFADPAAALGSPDDLTGENPPVFPNVTSPFSPPYQADEIVSIGEGGQLTLRLSHFAIPGPGREIGIFSNVGLVDVAFPNGTNASPADTFARQRPITVEVSRDGASWVTVSDNVSLEHPTLHYVNAGPFDVAPPASPQLADFGIPFEGSLASFDGKNWAQTVETFNTAAGYSAGGTWIELTATGLDRVGFIRLSLSINSDAAVDRFNIDAVSIANAAVGAPVPEPAALSALAAALLVSRRRR